MENLLAGKHAQQTKTKTRKKMSFITKLLITMVVLSAIVYGIWQNDSFERKFLYPYPYRQTVEFYADRYNVDKSLVAGVILTESKFKEEAVSVHGATGLMQLMPDTAQWIAHQIEDKNFSTDKLYNPQTNIKYGTWYLSELQDEFYGNKILMLAAYNAGRGNVHEWIDAYGWDKNFSDYNQIPFPETREYVKRVLDNEIKYQELYK